VTHSWPELVRDHRKRLEPRRSLERSTERPKRDGHLDRAIEGDGAARIGQRTRDVAACSAPTRTDHDHGDPLAHQAVPHQHRIRVLDERFSGVTLLREQILLRRQLVRASLERGDLVLEVAPLRFVDEPTPRDADADEDADDEREEDGGKRGDVVAKIEHQRVGAVSQRPPRIRWRSQQRASEVLDQAAERR